MSVFFYYVAGLSGGGSLGLVLLLRVEMLDLSTPAVRKLWAWPVVDPAQRWKNPLLVFAHTSFLPGTVALSSPELSPFSRHRVETRSGSASLLERSQTAPRRRWPASPPCRVRSRCHPGAPAGWEPGAVGPAGLKSPACGLRASPRGGCGRAGRGRRQCPGRLRRPRARAAVRLAAGSGHRRTPGRWRWPRRWRRAGGAGGGPGRAHTRSHTHTHRLVHTHTSPGAYTRRAGRRRRLGAARRRRLRRRQRARRAGGRAGGRPRSPAPRLRVQPARPSPSDLLLGGRPAPCPAAAAEQRAAAGGSKEPGGSRRRGDHVPGPGGGQPR